MQTRVHADTHTHTCRHTHTNTCRHAFTQIHTRTHADTRSRRYTHAHMQTHTHKHMQTRVHADTHTHTCRRTHPHVGIRSNLTASLPSLEARDDPMLIGTFHQHPVYFLRQLARNYRLPVYLSLILISPLRAGGSHLRLRGVILKWRSTGLRATDVLSALSVR